MANITQKCYIIILLVVGLSFCLVLLRSSANKWGILEFFSTAREVTQTSSKPWRLLYLVQTESCVPNHLMFPVIIGRRNICQCDVLVLSYERKCGDTPPEHVEYIFNSLMTSWNMGRNLLYDTAKKKNKQYLYYIFMDDDVLLKAKRRKNPWRLLEKSLKETEPAVAVVDVAKHGYLQAVYNGREK